MRPPSDSGKYLDSVIAIFLFAVFILLPPSVQFWATAESPWYLPYGIWLGLIVLVALAQWLRNRHEL